MLFVLPVSSSLFTLFHCSVRSYCSQDRKFLLHNPVHSLFSSLRPLSNRNKALDPFLLQLFLDRSIQSFTQTVSSVIVPALPEKKQDKFRPNNTDKLGFSKHDCCYVSRHTLARHAPWVSNMMCENCTVGVQPPSGF